MFSDDIFWFILAVILFYIIVVIIRLTGKFQKGKCPSCEGRLTRIQREFGDKLLMALTLGLLPFRRYKCKHCSWEGIRWSKRKEKKPSDPLPHETRKLSK